MASGEMWRLRRSSDARLRNVLHQADPPRFARPVACAAPIAACCMTERDHYLPGNRAGPGSAHWRVSSNRWWPRKCRCQVILPDGNLQTVRLTPDPFGPAASAASSLCARKGATRWNCWCRRARTNGSPHRRSRSRFPTWNATTSSAIGCVCSRIWPSAPAAATTLESTPRLGLKPGSWSSGRARCGRP